MRTRVLQGRSNVYAAHHRSTITIFFWKAATYGFTGCERSAVMIDRRLEGQQYEQHEQHPQSNWRLIVYFTRRKRHWALAPTHTHTHPYPHPHPVARE